MADTGKIYIVVTNKLPGGVTPGVPDTPASSGSESKNEKDLLTHYAMNRFINTLEGAAKSAVNFSLNNVGNFTGDYNKQRDINEARQILGMISNVAMAAWSGFKATGSPWGAIIGAGVSIFGQSISLIEQQIQIDVQQKKSDFAIKQIQERSGLNGAIDGSRGTEN